MRWLGVALVASAMAIIVVSAVSEGLDATGFVIVALVLGVGALSITVIRRSYVGRVSPRRCRECGGLLSVSAPYCKHCGARL